MPYGYFGNKVSILGDRAKIDVSYPYKIQAFERIFPGIYPVEKF